MKLAQNQVLVYHALLLQKLRHILSHLILHFSNFTSDSALDPKNALHDPRRVFVEDNPSFIGHPARKPN